VVPLEDWAVAPTEKLAVRRALGPAPAQLLAARRTAARVVPAVLATEVQVAGLKAVARQPRARGRRTRPLHQAL